MGPCENEVGMAGFEPTTSSTPCWRDTGLRYIPKGLQIYKCTGKLKIGGNSNGKLNRLQPCFRFGDRFL